MAVGAIVGGGRVMRLTAAWVGVGVCVVVGRAGMSVLTLVGSKPNTGVTGGKVATNEPAACVGSTTNVGKLSLTGIQAQGTSAINAILRIILIKLCNDECGVQHSF